MSSPISIVLYQLRVHRPIRFHSPLAELGIDGEVESESSLSRGSCIPSTKSCNKFLGEDSSGECTASYCLKATVLSRQWKKNCNLNKVIRTFIVEQNGDVAEVKIGVWDWIERRDGCE